MDVDTSYRDMMKTYTNELSLQEYKRRTNKKSYAIYAWVEVGKSPYTWKDDPINREIFFRYAHDTETLPTYLQNESGCRTMHEYKMKK